MAQSSMAAKFVSRALNNGGRCSRAMHDGVGTKKGLHNTDCVVGLVADSMGRSRVKLTAADVERTGITRVGPAPDILHQVPKMGMESTTATEPPLETKNNMVMTDPNSSMWNLCKENKDTESTAKKITRRFIKMKDNIKQYYIDRLEENNVMFTEIEEPLRIGKIDRKDRPMKYTREEDLEPTAEEVQSFIKAKKAQRLSLFNQLQLKPESEGEGKEEVISSSESQPKGYKKFNKLEYKKSSSMERDDMAEHYAEARANRMSKNEERMYMDQERPMVPSMWKRPSAKPDKEGKENRGEGGFSDVVGTMSPAVHFKYPRVGLRSGGLLNSLRSADLGEGLFKMASESRNYSTQMKNSGFDHYKPAPLILQRDIAFSCGNKFVDDKLITAHSISTCSKYYSDDPCRPNTLPPRECDPKQKLPYCPKAEGYKFPCCEKITLCGCCPVNPKVNIVGGCVVTLRGLLSMAKRPEYKCPSFSECLRRPEMGDNVRQKSECCINKKVCDNFVGPMKPFVTAIERQEMNLGQKYWTGQQQQCACYHRSVRSLFGSNAGGVIGRQTQVASFHGSAALAGEEECDRPSKVTLPCQKTVNIPGSRKKEKPRGKETCEKLCMPCCEPARDPPECLSIYQKGPCTKFRNPRPAYSECRKKFPFKHLMCECEVRPKIRCDHLKKLQACG